jgi:hypothetical protein
MLFEDSIFFLEELQIIEEFSEIVGVSLSDGVYKFDDFLILFGDGLSQDFVLPDEDFCQFCSLGEFQHPGTHVILQQTVVSLQLLDYLGQLGISVGHDLLLLLLLVGRLPYEFWVEISDELLLPIDLLDVLRHVAEDFIVLLHFLDEVVELVFDGLDVDIGP